MTYILFFLLSVLITTAVAYFLPTIVSKAELTVLSEYESVKSASLHRTPVNFLLALTLASVAPAFYTIQNDITVAIFINLLAVVSYIDVMRQWVPDILIHLLSWYSLCCLALGFINTVVNSALFSVLLYTAPFLIINACAWIKNRNVIYASGDIYILLPAGLWLDTYFALSAAMLSIVSASVYIRLSGKGKIPFTPFILFSFFIFSVL